MDRAVGAPGWVLAGDMGRCPTLVSGGPLALWSRRCPQAGDGAVAGRGFLPPPRGPAWRRAARRWIELGERAVRLGQEPLQYWHPLDAVASQPLLVLAMLQDLANRSRVGLPPHDGAPPGGRRSLLAPWSSIGLAPGPTRMSALPSDRPSTWRPNQRPQPTRSVLECGCPRPLSPVPPYARPSPGPVKKPVRRDVHPQGWSHGCRAGAT